MGGWGGDTSIKSEARNITGSDISQLKYPLPVPP